MSTRKGCQPERDVNQAEVPFLHRLSTCLALSGPIFSLSSFSLCTNCDSSLKKALDDAKSCIEKLLTSSSAKVMVSLPTPTPGSISERTSEFVQELSEFISTKRRLSDYHRRLFSVNNTGNFNRAISAAASSTDSPNPLNPDQLHVSEYGLKKLCINLKFGLYRSFGMNPPKKQASPEPEST